MNVKIITNTRWGGSVGVEGKYGLLSIDAPEFAAAYQPGQMCMLSVLPAGSTDPLLRRTFAPLSVKGGVVKIIYAVVGRGTDLLAKQPAGTVLSLSSPKGNRFKLVSNQRVALVAGGVGMAPIYCLAEALIDKGCEVHIFYGGRSKGDLFPEFHDAPAPYKWVLATEDGSHGIKGFSTNSFQENIQNFDMCYTCGPKPMMQAVQQICEKAGKPVQVSLEQVMACGIGVCAGCLVELKSGLKRCCTEGPVFNGHDVVW